MKDNINNLLNITWSFPQVSKLVASEILRQSTVIGRAAAIEKWAAVADICRCVHNYNSVLEITSALMNSSVYRLKKVWDKVPKQVPKPQHNYIFQQHFHYFNPH